MAAQSLIISYHGSKVKQSQGAVFVHVGSLENLCYTKWNGTLSGVFGSTCVYPTIAIWLLWKGPIIHRLAYNKQLIDKNLKNLAQWLFSGLLQQPVVFQVSVGDKMPEFSSDKTNTLNLQSLFRFMSSLCHCPSTVLSCCH